MVRQCMEGIMDTVGTVDLEGMVPLGIQMIPILLRGGWMVAHWVLLGPVDIAGLIWVATFQIIEGIVGAFSGFAQMLESTFMATHSSFFGTCHSPQESKQVLIV
jgi:hypothetical protein